MGITRAEFFTHYSNNNKLTFNGPNIAASVLDAELGYSAVFIVWLHGTRGPVVIRRQFPVYAPHKAYAFANYLRPIRTWMHWCLIEFHWCKLIPDLGITGFTATIY